MMGSSGRKSLTFSLGVIMSACSMASLPANSTADTSLYIQALWPMLSMRRKDSTAEGYGLTNPPGMFISMPARRLGIHSYYLLTDIRTTLVLLILSFIQPSTHTSIKLSLLDKGDAFSSIFRDIGKDSYALARRILDVSWEGIWGDTRIPFGTKIAAFGDQVLTSVGAYYHAL